MNHRERILESAEGIEETVLYWMDHIHREPTPEQERRHFEFQRAVAEVVIARVRAEMAEGHDPGDEDRR